MITSNFYHKTLKRYAIVFGTLFNEIQIVRRDNANNVVQTLDVPIAYGPASKFLSRISQNPDLNDPSAITLPRMSFEILNIQYDGERKIQRHRKKYSNANNDIATTAFVTTPYDIEFALNIMTKYEEDGNKIIEQIIPWFRPKWTSSVKMLDDIDEYFDTPLILQSAIREDTYEGDFEERRAIIWTLNFIMKGVFFGPVGTKKYIKFVDANIYDSLTANDVAESVTVQPGLTANGQPTTDINETVAYSQINLEDDWDYIVQIVEGE